MFLFSITCSLGPSSSWLGLIPVNSGPWETWLDLRKRVDRECWCDVQILPVPFSANIQGVQLGEHFVVREKVSIFFIISSRLYCGSVCSVSWLSLFLSCYFGGPLWYSTLQEADCAYIHSELLIRSSDIHRSNVHNWQTGGFLCFVLKDSLAPPACVFLLVKNGEMCQQQSYNMTTAYIKLKRTIIFWLYFAALTLQPSSNTLYVKRLLPSARISTSLEPCSSKAFFRLPVAWSM